MSRITEPLRAEHADLLPRVEAIRAAADRVGDEPASAVLPFVDAALTFLRRELIPHARAEDAALYPAVDRVLGAPGATQTMSLDHEEIGRLTDSLATLREELARGALSLHDAKELRLVLYGLYVLVRLHFHKEETAYLPVLDDRLSEGEGREIFESMEQAAAKVKSRL